MFDIPRRERACPFRNAIVPATQPVIDSLTTVLSIAAMILTVKRCSDQWLMWIIVNTASIWMWYKAYLAGEGSIAVLLMWIIALANGIIFYIQWNREIKNAQ